MALERPHNMINLRAIVYFIGIEFYEFVQLNLFHWTCSVAHCPVHQPPCPQMFCSSRFLLQPPLFIAALASSLLQLYKHCHVFYQIQRRTAHSAAPLQSQVTSPSFSLSLRTRTRTSVYCCDAPSPKRTPFVLMVFLTCGQGSTIPGFFVVWPYPYIWQFFPIHMAIYHIFGHIPYIWLPTIYMVSEPYLGQLFGIFSHIFGNESF